jgi:hypothetical protein
VRAFFWRRQNVFGCFSGVLHPVFMASALNMHQMLHWMNVIVIWVGLDLYVQWIVNAITTVHVRLLSESVMIVKVRKYSKKSVVA